jgi:small-conductance mechanosensitive channel
MALTDVFSFPTPPAALGDLADALLKPSALRELAALAGVLLLAWLLVRGLSRLRAQPDPGSVLFGAHVIDGLLFPSLVLAGAYAAQAAFRQAGLPLAVFKVAVPVFLSLALIRLAARVLRLAFPRSAWVEWVERSVSWLAWAGVVLWITGLLPALLDELDSVKWKFGQSTISLRALLEGSITAGVVMVLALWISAALERKLLVGPVDDLSMRKIAANLMRAALLFVGVLVALSAAGIDLTALSVLGGALGVGLGFGLQKLAANYVSGFVILAERSLRIGDMVRIDGFEGRITDIATRYTIVRALNGRESVIPNEMLITQRVENLSLADRRVLASTVVQVAYGTDLDALSPAIVEAVLAVERVLPEPGPAVQLSNFAADGLELTVVFWINDPENGTGAVRSDVNRALLRVFGAHAIEIPYPHRVVRVQDDAGRAAAAAAAAH